MTDNQPVYGVYDGEITDLESFMWMCASAHMDEVSLGYARPVPLNSSILYDEEDVAEYEEDLAEHLATPDSEWQSLMDRKNAAWVEAFELGVAKCKVTNDRLESMKAKVEAWEPPESGKDLKTFMLVQLEENIRTPPTLKEFESLEAIKDHYIGATQRGLEKAREHVKNVKNNKYINDANTWLDSLEASLPKETK